MLDFQATNKYGYSFVQKWDFRHTMICFKLFSLNAYLILKLQPWNLNLCKLYLHGVQILHFILFNEWATETRRGRPCWQHTLHQLAPHMTCDMWHVTCDTWRVTHDTWHVTCSTWLWVNILTWFQFPSSYCWGVKMFWKFGEKGSLSELMNELMTKVFLEQPRLPGVC